MNNKARLAITQILILLIGIISISYSIGVVSAEEDPIVSRVTKLLGMWDLGEKATKAVSSGTSTSIPSYINPTTSASLTNDAVTSLKAYKDASTALEISKVGIPLDSIEKLEATKKAAETKLINAEKALTAYGKPELGRTLSGWLLPKTWDGGFKDAA